MKRSAGGLASSILGEKHIRRRARGRNAPRRPSTRLSTSRPPPGALVASSAHDIPLFILRKLYTLLPLLTMMHLNFVLAALFVAGGTYQLLDVLADSVLTSPVFDSRRGAPEHYPTHGYVDV